MCCILHHSILHLYVAQLTQTASLTTASSETAGTAQSGITGWYWRSRSYQILIYGTNECLCQTTSHMWEICCKLIRSNNLKPLWIACRIICKVSNWHFTCISNEAFFIQVIIVILRKLNIIFRSSFIVLSLANKLDAWSFI